MAVRLSHILILFGFVAFSTQRNVDWDERLVKDSRDLHKLQSLLSKISRPQNNQALYHKERVQSNKRLPSKVSHNEREDIKHLLDDLEWEIKNNYQSQSVAAVKANEEFSEEPNREVAGYDSNSAEGDDESEDRGPAPGNVKSNNPDRNQYKDLLSLLQCNCGYDADQNQALRCAACSRDTPVVRARHSSPSSQSEHLLSLLNRYGKKYKLSDELDAVVIDVSNLDSPSKAVKSMKKRVSPFLLVDSKAQSSGLDLNSLQALQNLLQSQDRKVKQSKYSHAIPSSGNVYPQ